MWAGRGQLFANGILPGMMDNRWDIVVYDRRGQLQLAVETKSIVGTSVEWATELKQIVFDNDEFGEVPYFLLALPDRFYLWIEPGASADSHAPDYVADADSVLRPYFERSGLNPANIGHSTFDLIVGSWLSDVSLFEERAGAFPEWLTNSQLAQVIVGGRYAYGAVA